MINLRILVLEARVYPGGDRGYVVADEAERLGAYYFRTSYNKPKVTELQ